MFGRKKEAPTVPGKKSGGGKKLMADMGLMDPDDFGSFGLNTGDDDDDDNDADLEAELRALQEEDDEPMVSSKHQRNKKSKGNGKSMGDLDRMIAESMREIHDDEDVSDTENPDLLRELEQLSCDDEDDTPAVTTSKPLPRMSVSHGGAINGSNSAGGRVSNVASLTYKATPPAGAMKVLPTHSTRSVYPPGPTSSAVSPSTYSPAPRADPAAAAPIPRPSLGGGPPLTAPNPRASLAGGPPNTAARPAPPPPQATPHPRMSTGSAHNDDEDLSSLSSQDAANYRMMSSRRNEYKMAALSAKKSGDEAGARRYMRTAKQFDNVLEALKEGKPIDLSQMPPPPPKSRLTAGPSPPSVTVDRLSGSSTASGTAAAMTSRPINAQAAAPTQAAAEVEAPELTQEDKKKLFNAPEAAGSVMEAMQQRLAKYKEAEDQAKQENNSSKARRQARIVKQYEDAIKLYKAGKPVDLEELPCPPGFPPFPAEKGRPAAGAAPAAAQAAAATRPPAAASSAISQAPTAAAKPSSPTKPGLQKQMSVSRSRADQQCSFLEQRQAQFKQAALEAKASGDMELAKKYLRMAKGFDQMIEASRSGLPVDLAQVPAAPSTGSVSGFEIVDMPSKSEGGKEREGEGETSGDRGQMYQRLQDELRRQIKMSETNSEHFTKLGDVSSATKFDKMCQNSRKDLEALKNAYEHGDPVPRFHYETSNFSLVQSCTDLGDNDLEIVVVRGLNLNLPSGFTAADLNTYVKYEFPFPDTPQVGETATVKATNCPEYNQSFKLEVNRKSRSFLRMLKSNKVVKFELYYKRGFLKGDKLLGSVSFKLQPLEDKCVYHESFDLMDGRKAVGGKLEVKIRIRDPFVNKQVEAVTEKWLIIDQFERKEPPKPVPKNDAKPKPGVKQATPGGRGGQAAGPQSSAAGSQGGPAQFSASMSVLQYEKQQIDQQIEKLRDKLKPAEVDTLRQRGMQLERQAASIKDQLTKGGANAYRAYIDSMTRLNASYAQEARTLASNPATSKDKLQMILTKRKLVEKEVETLQQKLRI